MNKGLEALRRINENVIQVYGEIDSFENDLSIVEKELKAFEIIKKKIVDVALLFETFNYYKNGLKAYNTMRTRGYELTQEEYNLLKEVML